MSQPPMPLELLERARRSEAGEAVGTLLELYRNYLHLLAQTQIDLHVRGRTDPSDLVQETMMEAYRDFRQFRGRTEAELMGWLRRILVHNLARVVEKQLRTLKRDARREVSLEQRLAALENSSGRVEAALMSQGSSAGTQAQRRELAAVVADQLARLKPDYREVIILRNLEGLSFEEVARRMSRTKH